MVDLTSEIRADFDRIALLSPDGWGHNAHYHRLLLAQLPTACTRVLEIGCGTGAFSRLLALRARHVLALDLSPEMIRIARERASETSNIEFRVADVNTWALPHSAFDAVVTIATLHHLPFEAMLSRIKAALRPCGRLLVLDLYQAQGPVDGLVGLLALPVDTVLRLVKTGCLRSPPDVRQAWSEHGAHDSYLTLNQVRTSCARLLPGAQIRRHLLWRYSIVWAKPEEQ